MLVDGTAADRASAEARLKAMSPEDLERYLRGKTNFEILSVYEGGPWGMIDMLTVFREGTVIPDDVPLHMFTVNGEYTTLVPRRTHVQPVGRVYVELLEGDRRRRPGAGAELAT
jgi:hypothetical protein